MEQKKERKSRREIWRTAGVAMLGAGAMQAQTPGSWTPKKQSAGGPIRSGHLLFLSGIGGWYPDKRPKPGDVKQQTGDALQTMKASLEKAGSSMQNVLKVQVALVDPEKNWEGMDEIRTRSTIHSSPRAQSPSGRISDRPDFGEAVSCCKSTASPTWTEPFGVLCSSEPRLVARP